MLFNLGYSKTGTTSLEFALIELRRRVCIGYWESNHTHFLQALYVSDNVQGLVEFVQGSEFDTFSDAPWCGRGLYQRLDVEFPAAKFILTIREPQAWYNSLRNMVMKFGGGDDEHVAIANFYRTEHYGFSAFFVKEFGTDDLAERERIIAVYEAHNREVMEYFQDKQEKLLVLPTGELGWEPICRFLDVPIPQAEFPHKNPGEY